MQRIYRVVEGGEPHALAIREVAAVLRHGDLALIPTETVYGLSVSVEALATHDGGEPGAELVNGAAVPQDPSGYRRIFTVKRRSLAQTVPWLVDGIGALGRYGVGVAPEIRVLAEAFWPGALTVVVPAAPEVPAYLQAADGTVALRASASPVVQGLVRACGSPLATTSANTHGMPAPSSFSEVEPRVLAGVDVAVDAGATPCRDASTIVCMENGRIRILRQGALAAAKIDAVLKERLGAGHAALVPLAAPTSSAASVPSSPSGASAPSVSSDSPFPSMASASSAPSVPASLSAPSAISTLPVPSTSPVPPASAPSANTQPIA